MNEIKHTGILITDDEFLGRPHSWHERTYQLPEVYVHGYVPGTTLPDVENSRHLVHRNFEHKGEAIGIWVDAEWSDERIADALDKRK